MFRPQKLFLPVHPASLGLFRIFFGLTLFFHTIDQCRYIHTYYIQPQFHFSYPYLDFIRPLPGDGMFMVFALLLVCSIGIILGLMYRVAIIAFFLAYLYVFLIDIGYYKNHYYLILLTTFLMACANANIGFSFSGKAKEKCVYWWNIAILKFQFCVVYFFAGIAKINDDWFAGEPMAHTLRKGLASHHNHFLRDLVHQDGFINILVYGGLTFDLGIGFLLLNRRTRLLGAVIAVTFHVLNHILLVNIQTFAYLMLASLILFFDPAWPVRIGRRIKGEKPRSMTIHHEPKHLTKPQQKLAVVITVYCLIQLLLPLRHTHYPGNVMWTSQGERFAWRMILKREAGFLKLRLEDPTLAQPRIYEEDYFLSVLNRRQYITMKTRPEMILLFAHYLRDEAVKSGLQNPEVYAASWHSINGREPQQQIRPDVNLVRVGRFDDYMKWNYPFNSFLPDER